MAKKTRNNIDKNTQGYSLEKNSSNLVPKIMPPNAVIAIAAKNANTADVQILLRYDVERQRTLGLVATITGLPRNTLYY